MNEKHIKTRRTNVTSRNVVSIGQVRKALAEEVVLDSHLTDHLDEWVKFLHRKGLSPFTIDGYVDHLKVIIKHLPPHETLETLTAEKFETFVFDPMREEGYASNTINGRVKALRQFYNYLVAKRYVLSNVANNIQLVKNKNHAIPSLSKEQIHTLLRQPNLSTFTGFRDFTLIQLMLDCGIRLREATELTTSQVDLEQRRLKDVYGKNGRFEDIPLSKPMCRQLSEYLEERGEVPSTALFVTIDGAPLSRRHFQERLSEYGKKANIRDVRVSPHTLRHTFAKQWVLNGGDPFSLQRILRHSTMDMVKRYVYLWANEVQEQHDKFSPLAKMSKEWGGRRAK